MPSIRIKPQTGEVYHVYNRGIEKRDIFIKDEDFVRFLHDLYEFNDENPALEFSRRNVRGETPHIISHKRKPLVEILAFCLMDNHYHLVLRQLVDNGISLFMKKIGAGYTVAFNLKYERVGPLFQGVYKTKHIGRDEYLNNLICYIHANPVDRNIDKNFDLEKTRKTLDNYKWSSHLDYMGKRNFGSIIHKKFHQELFGSAEYYDEYINNWLKNKGDRIDSIQDLILEN